MKEAIKNSVVLIIFNLVGIFIIILGIGSAWANPSHHLALRICLTVFYSAGVALFIYLIHKKVQDIALDIELYKIRYENDILTKDLAIQMHIKDEKKLLKEIRKLKGELKKKDNEIHKNLGDA